MKGCDYWNLVYSVNQLPTGLKTWCPSIVKQPLTNCTTEATADNEYTVLQMIIWDNFNLCCVVSPHCFMPHPSATSETVL